MGNGNDEGGETVDGHIGLEGGHVDGGAAGGRRYGEEEEEEVMEGEKGEDSGRGVGCRRHG